MRISENALAKIQLDKSHGNARQGRAQAQRGQASSSSSGSSHAAGTRDQAYFPRLDRCRLVLCRSCKPRRQLTSLTRLACSALLQGSAGCLRWQLAKARPGQQARRSAKRVYADPCPFLVKILNRSVNAVACQIHIFQIFKRISMDTQLRPTNGSARFAGECSWNPTAPALSPARATASAGDSPVRLTLPSPYECILLWFPCSY